MTNRDLEILLSLPKNSLTFSPVDDQHPMVRSHMFENLLYIYVNLCSTDNCSFAALLKPNPASLITQITDTSGGLDSEIPIFIRNGVFAVSSRNFRRLQFLSFDGRIIKTIDLEMQQKRRIESEHIETGKMQVDDGLLTIIVTKGEHAEVHVFETQNFTLVRKYLPKNCL